eukprot:TRINITY_DN9348_c0_g1_i5.p2 TRINITY_DN9348_c0_g1~~TRINITY_DN9348_c0_g1_i5.p2  ORF type:complete len:151 (+),score=0.61 TRINITY_DN9348_c0_g1_i5:198-650(+)
MLNLTRLFVPQKFQILGKKLTCNLIGFDKIYLRSKKLVEKLQEIIFVNTNYPLIQSFSAPNTWLIYRTTSTLRMEEHTSELSRHHFYSRYIDIFSVKLWLCLVRQQQFILFQIGYQLVGFGRMVETVNSDFNYLAAKSSWKNQVCHECRE